MRKIKIILALIVVSGFVTSCRQKAQKPAHLRLGQFLISNTDATITIKKNDTLIREESLSYPTLTDYHDLKPGIYTFTVSIGDKTILQKDFGMGKGTFFTLCIFGIPDTSLSANYQTTKDQLHSVFAGTEAHTANGDLPKCEMLIDNFQKGPDEAQIRWLHLAPGLNALEATAVNENDSEDLSKADYAETIDNKSLAPGTYEFSWNVDGSLRKLVRIEKDIESQKIYTFFVLGNRGTYSDSLQVISGATTGN